MSIALAWITALLLAVRVPLADRACIEARRDRIASNAEAAAAQYGVLVTVLLSVAYRESHLGCDPRSGGSWGAPISRTRRHVAGGANAEASALALGYRRCFTHEGAISHFRWGVCSRGRHRGYGPEEVLELAARVAAHVAPPAD